MTAQEEKIASLEFVVEKLDTDLKEMTKLWEAGLEECIAKDAEIENLKASLSTSQELYTERSAGLESAIEANRALHVRLAQLPTMEAYLLEVSKFHRAALLPLIELVQNIVKTAGATAEAEMQQVIANVKGFLQTIENRTKHFENDKLVQEARDKALAELKRLTVK